MSQSIDEQQFAELLEQAYPKFWTLACAIVKDRALAEDVVQDAAITGLRKITDFEAGTNFTVWMGQIVRFTSLNYLKSRKIRKTAALGVHGVEEPVAQQQSLPPVTTTGELTSDQTDFDDDLSNAINLLSPEKRTCLLLRVVHELSYEEIAEIVGVPEGTAMSHVHRAKATMRNSLSQTGMNNFHNNATAGIDGSKSDSIGSEESHG